ncbi:hypothetical protein SCOR_08905 [Sulfidibacter corallicola]|uniref:Uncharacterized protein n=1 Tax=Sulfidibacter corallicola TaxID=2818388 RepID=A0A8A4TNJ0_SULCO|nr:type III secretion HpaP family protein [Sulfidibacter corallicola]QTD51123.1 hypothetical protein J3U87_01530 [Sulfidibacter corallicola]
MIHFSNVPKSPGAGQASGSGAPAVNEPRDVHGEQSAFEDMMRREQRDERETGDDQPSPLSLFDKKSQQKVQKVKDDGQSGRDQDGQGQDEPMDGDEFDPDFPLDSLTDEQLAAFQKHKRRQEERRLEQIKTDRRQAPNEPVKGPTLVNLFRGPAIAPSEGPTVTDTGPASTSANPTGSDPSQGQALLSGLQQRPTPADGAPVAPQSLGTEGGQPTTGTGTLPTTGPGVETANTADATTQSSAGDAVLAGLGSAGATGTGKGLDTGAAAGPETTDLDARAEGEAPGLGRLGEAGDGEAGGDGDGGGSQSQPQSAGDAILNLLQANRPVSGAAGAQGPLPPAMRTIAEVADKIVDRILVSDKSLSGDGEVRLMLKDSVLPGTEVRILRHAGALQIQMVTQSTDAYRLLAEKQDNLQAFLTERLNDREVRVELNFKDQGADSGANRQGDQHSDGRSRHRRDLIEEMEEE